MISMKNMTYVKRMKVDRMCDMIVLLQNKTRHFFDCVRISENGQIVFPKNGIGGLLFPTGNIR